MTTSNFIESILDLKEFLYARDILFCVHEWQLPI
jgi:hypothetical protein